MWYGLLFFCISLGVDGMGGCMDGQNEMAVAWVLLT